MATSRATPRKSSIHWPTRACCSSRFRPRKLTWLLPGNEPSERAEQGKQGEQGGGQGGGQGWAGVISAGFPILALRSDSDLPELWRGPDLE